MSQPYRLLDLFCKAGGASRGYARAGFQVEGVDIAPQKRYPYAFHHADALTWPLTGEYDVIHASPPCQAHSCTRHLPNARPEAHGECLDKMVERLQLWARATGGIWVVENVPAAPLSLWAVELCGLMFGLKVFRHRRFESNHLLLQPHHVAHGTRRIGKDGYCCVAGNGGCTSGWKGGPVTPGKAATLPKKDSRRIVPYDHRSAAAWSRAMGIDWMTRDELSQAIPPDYTEYLGRQLMELAKLRREERAGFQRNAGGGGGAEPVGAAAGADHRRVRRAQRRARQDGGAR